MSNARAVRYRRLALATEDKDNADSLLKLADECDRGLLCTAEWLSAAGLSRKNEQPPKAGGARVRDDPTMTDVENVSQTRPLAPKPGRPRLPLIAAAVARARPGVGSCSFGSIAAGHVLGL